MCSCCQPVGASFCNELVCTNGVWTQVEVAPPHTRPVDAGPRDPRCPIAPPDTLCGKPCSQIGLDCSMGGAGPTCLAGPEDGDGGTASWWCGV